MHSNVLENVLHFAIASYDWASLRCPKISLAFGFALALVRPDLAPAQSWNWESCIIISEKAAEESGKAFSLAPPEASHIVSQISSSIELDRPVGVIPCDFMREIAVVPPKAPNGTDYILINTNLLSFILDTNSPEQAQFIIAHELAHILNADFSHAKDQISRKVKEDEADLFGTCAVARLGGDWANLETFLLRLRSVEHEDYSLFNDVRVTLKNKFAECASGTTNFEVVEEVLPRADEEFVQGTRGINPNYVDPESMLRCAGCVGWVPVGDYDPTKKRWVSTNFNEASGDAQPNRIFKIGEPYTHFGGPIYSVPGGFEEVGWLNPNDSFKVVNLEYLEFDEGIFSFFAQVAPN